MHDQSYMKSINSLLNTFEQLARVLLALADYEALADVVRAHVCVCYYSFFFFFSYVKQTYI